MDAPVEGAEPDEIEDAVHEPPILEAFCDLIPSQTSPGELYGASVVQGNALCVLARGAMAASG